MKLDAVASGADSRLSVPVHEQRKHTSTCLYVPLGSSRGESRASTTLERTMSTIMKCSKRGCQMSAATALRSLFCGPNMSKEWPCKLPSSLLCVSTALLAASAISDGSRPKCACSMPSTLSSCDSLSLSWKNERRPALTFACSLCVAVQ